MKKERDLIREDLEAKLSEQIWVTEDFKLKLRSS